MLKNLKSLFIVEEEDNEPVKKQASTKGSGQSEAAPTVSRNSSPAKAQPSSRPGKVTTKFTDILLSAMESANLDGFDYLEYKKSLQSLQKMNMDEGTAYQSAFAMASTMGATPARLVETAEHYLKVLRTEEQKFQAALAKQQQAKIDAQRKEQEQLAK
ncbi:MAG: hypothetical protein D6772_05520, partial [Bacteroidetes bacterium]